MTVEMPEVEGLSHRQVRVGSFEMHVAEAGSGPPVLMLHGWPQHWYVWRHVAPKLAAHRRVICPDLRGFGWSDAPAGDYSKPALARDVVDLLDALELDRVDLIGHDWGGWIGFILCLDHPERFDHYLALNIPTLWPDPPSLRGLQTLARLWYQAAIATPALGERLIRETGFVRKLITAGAVHRAWDDADLCAFTDVLRERERAAASVQLYRTFLLRELLPLLRGRYEGRRLTVPTLLLHGTHDLAIDHRSLGRWREHADEMELELREDSGHFIVEEIPDVIVDRAFTLFGVDISSPA
jgi:pimeloyl-ACP methyl ester carboxylesterase